MADLGSPTSEGIFRHVYHQGSAKIPPLANPEGVQIGYLPASTFESFNSAYPNGDGDGALWQGRGLSGLTRAGIAATWDWGMVSFNPEWWFAQNQDFSRAGGATTGDYGPGLDRLQSYGTGYYQNFEWGQSEARLVFHGFTLGFGTENIKLGPAEIQNIILSDNAAGFPMLDIGTDGPIKTGLGALDARFFWGQTTLSSWYDSDPSTREFLWCGGALSYSPPFLDSMSFGFVRAFHSPWSTLDGWKVFEFFDDSFMKNFRKDVPLQSNGEDDIDQVLSLTWEWRVPETGSRAYVEWARNDHAGDIMDFLMQPDHSQGYVIGLQQRIAAGDIGQLLVSAEFSDLGNTIGSTIRPTGSWYRHSLVDNNGVDGGYTNDGQIFGSPMGPGSNAQEVNVYFLGNPWFVGIGMQRLLMDADYSYTTVHITNLSYNLYLTTTFRAGIRLADSVELSSAIAFVTNWNHNFVPGSVNNWHVEAGVKIGR
ncbi:MAG TPA: capsule assembly Wzi family protein [Rectinemataceae bacterium]|nr:capsule assembly Wzi family protein [Rectinemataceae bacterium]